MQVNATVQGLVTVTASVPVGVVANIVVPKMGVSDTALMIAEGSDVVWAKGKFVPIFGITGAMDQGDSILFGTGSGDFKFTVFASS